MSPRIAIAACFVLSVGAAPNEAVCFNRAGGRHPYDNLRRYLRSGAALSQDITVEHKGHGSDGYPVAESPYFRIVHNHKTEVVEKVARAAEHVRVAIHRQWFGEAPYDWEGRCTIHLYSSHFSYSYLTNQPGSLGHARSFTTQRYVGQRSIHIPANVPGFLEDVLPHEITHTVMAIRFNGRTPRWANEGMAMLSESAEARERFQDQLRDCWRKDDLFAPEVVMHTNEQRHIMTVEYYAQSMSLVEFFVAEKGRRTFVRFLRDSIRTSYAAGLKKHYSIHSFAELERRWRAFAFPVSQSRRAPQGLTGGSHGGDKPRRSRRCTTPSAALRALGER
jgi:hypothetical protein